MLRCFICKILLFFMSFGDLQARKQQNQRLALTQEIKSETRN